MKAGGVPVGGSSPSPGGIAFNAVLLAVAGALLAATADMRASAAIVPRVVAVPLIALLGYRLLRDVITIVRSRERRSGEGRTREEIAAILWLFALPTAATLLGFVAGPALWVVGWAKLRAGERGTVAAGAGVVTAIVILLVFGGLLGVRLPHGVFAR